MGVKYDVKINLRIVPCQARLVFGDIVSSLGLVDANLTLTGHVVEVLVAVNTCLLWCGPTGCVNTSSASAAAILLLPVYEESNCVLGLLDAAQISSNTFAGAACYFDRLVIWDHALIDVNVVLGMSV